MSVKFMKFEDLAEVTAGQGAPQEYSAFSETGNPFIRAGNLEELLVTNDEYASCDLIDPTVAQKYKLKLFPENTIVFAKSGMSATKGRIYSLKNDSYIVNHLAIAICNPNLIDHSFLKYYLVAFPPSRLIKDSAYPSISLNDIKQIKIPLPSLEDQHRIVKILDLAQSLIEKRKQAIAYLDDYIKAVFLDMFGDPVSNPKGWEVGKIGDLVSEINYGTSAKAGSIGKFPYLRMNNITFNGEFNLCDLKYIDLAESDIDKYTVSKGDLLFNRTNSKELVGKTAVVNFEDSMAFAGYLIRVRTNKKAIPEYISGYLNSKHGKTTLMHMCKSIVGMANINAKELQKMRILIPSVQTQEIYKKIYYDMQSLKQKMQTQLKDLENNFQAQLQRAFREE